LCCSDMNRSIMLRRLYMSAMRASHHSINKEKFEKNDWLEYYYFLTYTSVIHYVRYRSAFLPRILSWYNNAIHWNLGYYAPDECHQH
jgi:hypothetical protein